MDDGPARYSDATTFAERYQPPTLVVAGAHIMTTGAALTWCGDTCD